MDRAKAVEEMLVKLGISADRIATEGCSDSNPVSTNDTGEGRLDNRRAEVVLESR